MRRADGGIALITVGQDISEIKAFLALRDYPLRKGPSFCGVAEGCGVDMSSFTLPRDQAKLALSLLSQVLFVGVPHEEQESKWNRSPPVVPEFSCGLCGNGGVACSTDY